MSSPQFEQLSTEDAIQRLFTMMGDFKEMITDIHERLKTSEENIVQLDRKINAHVRNESVHCDRPDGVRRYRVTM